ncbi:amine oxidase-9 [Coleophoma cylindrospora]|uniref:Amine oxidase n=1 Tax=Coleophoma cylindrospora TaxID=1849047 RepID=A0A3D8RGE9_9HELO|nr:amine oxidase-9 [Coleophoma cylindrospora]
MGRHIKTLDPRGISASGPIFSHVATSQGPTKLIYTSGQVGTDSEGNVPSSYEKQVDNAFRNLAECLNAAGAGVADIIQLRWYIVAYDPTNRYHAKVLLAFLGGHRPATTLVPVPALAKAEYLFEIEAVAAVRDLASIPAVIKPKAGGVLDIDVVVVGGGLSGLQSAHDIQRAGYSCVVLEARDRVGGKTWSRPTKCGGYVDVGAAWINDTNQSRMFALAKRFGLDLIEQCTEGNCAAESPDGGPSIIFPYGEVPNFSEADTADIVRVRDLFEELCHTIDIKQPWAPDHDSVTLEQFMKERHAGEKALGIVNIWTRAMLGCESSEMSALYFLDYCKSGGGLLQMRGDRKHGGQYLRIRTGTQSFSTNIAASMVPGSVILEAPVLRIAQNMSGASVTTEDGSRYRCKKVIVSIPTPAYKEISFLPPLPLDKVRYSNSSMLGYYAKMIMVYDKPWWREAGFCGMTQSFVGPMTVTRDTSDEAVGLYSLTCFVVGEPGRLWSKLDGTARQEAIMAQLIVLFGTEQEANIRSATEIFEQEWAKDPWSRGCPCPVVPPGIMTEVGTALRRPDGALHFVGTETSFEWKGYMEGAVRSGERGAAEVIEALQGANRMTSKL